MELFLVVVLLLALLAPVLSVILFKKSKKYREEIALLISGKNTLGEELGETQKKLAQAVRDHAELEGKATPLWQYQELHDAVLDAEKKIKTADAIAREKLDEAQNKRQER